ncbi:MAG: PhzF family phenazine biosynthesis protein [Rhodocyclaceae bacterium]|nr:PhzF family phenazine biosynthesis protein [Rhodocyclaceae bacterium]MBP6109351.1 PhzF family phenazine biosynthesis protein [Rhodocyclaceae bacterium]MBP6279372.1 PhzF family phenazine biosynthesis protein [Rhodocyclaceae bacterium]
MASYRFRLLNVFAQTTLGGNPLAVFEDARGLDDTTMQALARQFNLSETTFLFPSEIADTRVRIFTPNFEMPFAGHPTLGTAHVVRDLKNTADSLTLDMQAGCIPVKAIGDEWTLRSNAPTSRPFAASRSDLATALGLTASDIEANPVWINTGTEQLVVPISNLEAIDNCRPNSRLIDSVCGDGQRNKIYLWAKDGAPVDGVQQASVRFFFPNNGALSEDPGTGSACANLGGYFVVTQMALPQTWVLRQGSHINKPCQLRLHVDAQKAIFVGGRVIELGRGEISL